MCLALGLAVIILYMALPYSFYRFMSLINVFEIKILLWNIFLIVYVSILFKAFSGKDA